MAKVKEHMQALVPTEEQPYEVPENWRWEYLSSVTTRIKRGKSPKYVENSEYPAFAQKCNQKDGTIAMEKAQFVSGEQIAKLSEDDFLKDQDVVVNSTGTGTLGRVGYYRSDYALPYVVVLPDSHVTVVRGVPQVAQPYLFYYLKSKQDYLEGQGAGSTNQKELRPDTISNMLFPLPPLPEQRRIVDRIESLFAKLDEAKGKAQAVVDGFESRKAAILQKAFSGELTEGWRRTHHTIADEWKRRSFDSCISKMQNGLSKRIGTIGEPRVVLRLANLSDNGFVTNDLRTIVIDEKEQLTYELMPGDVVMIRVNGSRANVAKQILVTENQHWAFCDHIIRVRYTDDLDAAFMVYVSKTEHYRLYVKDHMVSSAGQNTISRKGLADLTVAVPSLPEQREIVRILDSLLSKEQQAHDAALDVLDRIDEMKNAVLAKAFRGQLGTNVASEETTVI